MMSDTRHKVYGAWDINTRVFHWINFLCVIILSMLGLIMLNKSWIGISGNEASIGLKVIHVTTGYVFATNLLIRIAWGFLGGRRARWSSLLPGKSFKQELAGYKASVSSGKPQTFIGHNPKGRLAVLFMMLLLTVMMTTGMVRAGTDIYYPPFGQFMARYVAAEGINFDQVKPYDETGTDADKYAKLKAFKKPWGTVHLYTAYLLWLMVLLHVFVVIRTDTGGQGTLISSMFSGKKYLPREPEDP